MGFFLFAFLCMFLTLTFGIHALTQDDEVVIPQVISMAIPESDGEAEEIWLTITVDEIELESEFVSVGMNYAASSMVYTTYEIRTVEEILEDRIGDATIDIAGIQLISYSLPSKYYSNLDYSSFQPWMSYTTITNKSSQGYALCNSANAYTDANGFRRYKVSDDEFSINGQDDYIVALGTYYKEKGVIGNRYLVVTTEGMFTVRTGDEKDDRDTDQYNMFTTHDGKAGLIEWIVDSSKLDSQVKLTGNAVSCEDFEELHGEILYIYEIQD